MQESYREGVAIHSGPEPCEDGRKAVLEALDRGICRLGMELRNPAFSGADTVRRCGRRYSCGRYASPQMTRRSRRPQAFRAATVSTYGLKSCFFLAEYFRHVRFHAVFMCVWPRLEKNRTF
jgi:hypothetical protein